MHHHHQTRATRPATTDAIPIAVSRSYGARLMRYPRAHLWLGLFASLDLVLTGAVLHLGGRELNVVAEAVIRHFGLPGAAVFKFGLIAFVIWLCEIIGRRDPLTGRRFSTTAIVVTCMPVAAAAVQLLSWWWAVSGPAGRA